MSMKLSIITVNYNNIEGLRRTLSSVLSQTWTNFEWIVIDGGSSDGSRELIEEHASNFAYWCSERDGGIYEAMNKGVRHSRGEYLNFLNSGDTYYKSGTLEELFGHEITADVIYGDAGLRSEEGEMAGFWITPLQITIEGYLNGFCVNHQSSLIRRTLMLSHLYDESYRISADAEFFVNALVRGATFKKIDIPISVYQQGGLSGREHRECSHEFKRAMLANIKNVMPAWFNLAYRIIPNFPIRPKWALVRFLYSMAKRMS